MDQELTPEQLDAVARASVGGLCEINGNTTALR